MLGAATECYIALQLKSDIPIRISHCYLIQICEERSDKIVGWSRNAAIDRGVGGMRLRSRCIYAMEFGWRTFLSRYRHGVS